MAQKTSKSDLERVIGALNTTYEEEIAYSSYSNGRRRIYRIVLIEKDGMENQISKSGYITEAYAFCMGLLEAKHLTEK